MTPLRFALALLALTSLHAGPSRAAQSTCMSPSGAWPTLSISPMSAIAYQGIATSVSVTLTISMPSNSIQNCATGIEINPGSSTGVLYGPSGGQLTYQASGLMPWDPSWNRTTFTVPTKATVSYSFTLTLPGGQSAPVGAYSSASFEVRLLNTATGGHFRMEQFALTANVTTTCELPPPDVASLDFTPAISNGRIPAPVQQQVTFRNAGCNGPTRLTLSGESMRLPSSTGPAIAYTASASIGSQQLTLDTAATASVYTQTASGTGGGTIPVTITVQPTALLPAGRYRSTLTVGLTPAQ